MLRIRIEDKYYGQGFYQTTVPLHIYLVQHSLRKNISNVVKISYNINTSAASVK